MVSVPLKFSSACPVPLVTDPKTRIREPKDLLEEVLAILETEYFETHQMHIVRPTTGNSSWQGGSLS